MSTYFLNVTQEPEGFHETASYALHLAPDTRAAADHAAGRALIEAFLDDARTIRRALVVALDTATSEPGVTEELSLPDLLAGGGFVHDVLPWIDARAQIVAAQAESAEPPDVVGALRTFWVGRPGADTGAQADETITVKAATILPAMDLLRGSLAWPAPLPQQAGLVRLAARAMENPLTDTHFVIPWWEDTDPTTLTVVKYPSGDAVTLAMIENDPDMALRITADDRVFITRAAEAFDLPDGFSEDGWIAPSDLLSREAVKLRKVRAAWGSKLAPLPAVQDFVPTPAGDSQADINHANTAKIALANWIDENGGTLLMDRFDLAFRNSGRAGRLWESLRDIYEDVLEEVNREAETGAERALKPEVDWVEDCGEAGWAEVLALLGVPIEDAEMEDAEEARRDGQKLLETALLRLNEMALELTNPDKLLDVMLAYLACSLGDWTSPFAEVADTDDTALGQKARARFAAHYGGATGDLAADLDADGADLFMRKLEAILRDPALNPGNDRLETALTQMEWVRGRFGGAGPGDWTDLLAFLRQPADFPDEIKAEMLGDGTEWGAGHLGGMHTAAVAALLSDSFVADLEPQPLGIIASGGFDPEAAEHVARHTTGVGVVIGVAHPVASGDTPQPLTETETGEALAASVAHVSAAALTPPPGLAGFPRAPGVIEPSTLCDNFGQIEIEVPFNGVPLIGRLVASGAQAALATAGFPLPYQLSHADYVVEEDKPGGQAEVQKLRHVPPLAYGYRYAANAYYIPNSGVLPPAVRDADHPLIPADPTNVPVDPAQDFHLRRTEVANVPLSTRDASHHKGLGYVPRDVFPIAPDLFAAYEMDYKPRDPALLLLGQGETWKPGVRGPAQLKVEAPRVSFEDFDRWMMNPKLRKAIAIAHGINPTHQAGLDAFDTGIEAIEDARDYLEELNIPAAAEQANRLPDPAVAGLHIRLEIFDELLRPVTVETHEKVLPIKAFDALPPVGEAATYRDYMALLSKIDENAGFALIAEAGNDRGIAEIAGQRGVEITVKPGDIALLTVSPLVSTAHYDGTTEDDGRLIALHSALHKDAEPLDLTEGALQGPFRRLSGAAVLLEAMQAPALGPVAENRGDAVLEALRIRPEGRDRGYRFELSPTLKVDTHEQEGNPGKIGQWIYRAFAEVDVVTQQWRPIGQPIYNWIAPAPQGGSDSPVVDLSDATDGDGLAAIDRFEADAFFGRAQFDGERRRVRLPAFLPGDDQSENAVLLDAFRTPSPAATALRYTQEWRLRYIGALATGDGVYPALEPDPDADASNSYTHRVAILADTSGGAILAPQVRHVLPSLIPDGDRTGPLPFVCSLNERPFDQYGLADRLAAEVSTIQTFEMIGADTDQKLAFGDYRKEVGPEPRTSLTGIPRSASRAITLRAEGPVGHHFDPPNADAPGFVNTSYLLQLEGVGPKWDGQQIFAKVDLRRFTDPGWTWTPPMAEDATLPDSWLTDLDQVRPDAAMVIAHEVLPKPDAVGEPDGEPEEEQEEQPILAAVVKVTRALNDIVVHVSRTNAYQSTVPAKDGAPGESEATFAELCRISTTDQRVLLAYRRLEQGGHEIVVLAQERNGPMSLSSPQIVASARYLAEGPMSTEGLDRQRVSPLLIGGALAGAWVQSGYDMVHFHVGNRTATLSEVRPTLDGSRLGFATPDRQPLRLASRDAGVEHALNAHAHLAAMTLSRSKAAGRTLLLPKEITLLDPVGRSPLRDEARPAGLVLMAFESPAEVLDLGQPDATFDLDAVLTRDDGAYNASGDILLRCRITEIAAEAGDEVVLTLTSRGDPECKATVTLSGDTLDALHYLDLRIDMEGRVTGLRGYGHGAQGVEFDPDDVAKTEGEVGPLRRSLTLAVGGTDALCMDVSMIPQTPTADGQGGWNWDWVFPLVAETAEGTAVGSTPDLELATEPGNLGAQTEAVLVPRGMTDVIAFK